MRVKKIALLMVPVLLLLCCSFAVAGNVVEYTYDADGNIQDVIVQSSTVQISADPAIIYEGQSSTLTWSSTSTTACEIQPEVGGGLPPSGFTTVFPTTTTTYTITATGLGGTASNTVTVTVEPPPPPPTVTISATPMSIAYGETSTLSWTSTNADTVSIDQGIGTVTPPEGGSIDVSPTVTTIYTITATGPLGATDTAEVTVTVAPPPEPTVTISADPASIQYGASSTLSWTSTNADTVSIDQGIGTVTPPEGGSIDVSPTVTTTYTITAEGAGGTLQDDVTVMVTTPPPPETLTLRPNAPGDQTGISIQNPASGSHYDKVDEVTADDYVTYLATVNYSAYEYDLYNIPDHATETGAINYVKIYYRVYDYYQWHKPALKTGGTVYYGAETQSTTASWTTYSYTWNINPNTGAAWTWSDIDALQIGIAMKGYIPYCTQVYVEVNYIPGPPPPQVSISADPVSIYEGGSSTLTWISTDATSCTIDQGIGTVDPNGSTTVSPTATTTYTITATGPGGTAEDSVTVTVTPPPLPTVSITADPETIYEGQSTTLTWTSTDATSCDIQPEVGGDLPPNGSTTVSPTATTTYTITATGLNGGTAEDSVTVTVEAPPPPPTVTISANPESIAYGESSALTWSSTDATSCSIDQGIGTVTPPEGGSVDVSPTVTTIYTITATGPLGATDTAEVTVTVAPPPEPTVTISADPASIQYGASSTLSWTSTNADTISIDQGIGTVTPPEGGSIDVSPTVTTTYTITAEGAGGTLQDDVTVTVTTPPPPETLTLRPNAPGDQTDIPYQNPASGSHYDKVDEVGADDSSTFLYTTAYWYRYDLYNIPDHTTEAGAINYVKIYYRVNGLYSLCYFKPAIKTGGTVYYGTETQLGSGVWTSYNYTWNTNPQTGAAWTWSDIDALQIGIAMKNYIAECTQVYVEVTYIPSP